MQVLFERKSKKFKNLKKIGQYFVIFLQICIFCKKEMQKLILNLQKMYDISFFVYVVETKESHAQRCAEDSFFLLCFMYRDRYNDA